MRYTTTKSTMSGKVVSFSLPLSPPIYDFLRGAGAAPDFNGSRLPSFLPSFRAEPPTPLPLQFPHCSLLSPTSLLLLSGTRFSSFSSSSSSPSTSSADICSSPQLSPGMEALSVSVVPRCSSIRSLLKSAPPVASPPTGPSLSVYASRRSPPSALSCSTELRVLLFPRRRFVVGRTRSLGRGFASLEISHATSRQNHSRTAARFARTALAVVGAFEFEDGGTVGRRGVSLSSAAAAAARSLCLCRAREASVRPPRPPLPPSVRSPLPTEAVESTRLPLLSLPRCCRCGGRNQSESARPRRRRLSSSVGRSAADRLNLRPSGIEMHLKQLISKAKIGAAPRCEDSFGRATRAETSCNFTRP